PRSTLFPYTTLFRSEKLLVGDELADFLSQPAVQLLLADDLVKLDAAFVVAGAVRVADGDHLAAGLGEQFGGGVANITDALDGDGRVLGADLQMPQRRQRGQLATPAGRFGSTFTPPFAPPYGIPTTAHFQVIHMARALTSSMFTPGW